MGKALIVYYSYSGITRGVAESIAILTDGDIFELRPEKPYSLTYNTAVKEARNEIERDFCPKLEEYMESIDKYDTIFVGSPNWLKTFVPPVLTFLREMSFKDKKVIPFCTHGGGGFGNMVERIKDECKEAAVLKGLELLGSYRRRKNRTMVKRNRNIII
ncbi:flavodoxin [Peptostreptococcus faecalis]|uniref:flavodoxin n=1 Tax=Peptostreptococcus faecalis TaxID=2045015 RepID=UPI000C7E3B4F|nr:flavodoxin [Peptostreptococcus faecalis]